LYYFGHFWTAIIGKYFVKTMLTQRQMANTTLDPPVFNLTVLDPPVLSFSRLLDEFHNFGLEMQTKAEGKKLLMSS
jgi:hypothetical protein